MDGGGTATPGAEAEGRGEGILKETTAPFFIPSAHRTRVKRDSRRLPEEGPPRMAHISLLPYGEGKNSFNTRLTKSVPPPIAESPGSASNSDHDRNHQGERSVNTPLKAPRLRAQLSPIGTDPIARTDTKMHPLSCGPHFPPAARAFACPLSPQRIFFSWKYTLVLLALRKSTVNPNC